MYMMEGKEDHVPGVRAANRHHARALRGCLANLPSLSTSAPHHDKCWTASVRMLCPRPASASAPSAHVHAILM